MSISTATRKSYVVRGDTSVFAMRSLAFVSTHLLIPYCFGLGVRIPNQDTEAIARGNAFAATADNPSALYYNPAGITQLEGQHYQFGLLSYLGINVDYQSPSGLLGDNKLEVLPVPQIYTSFSLTDTALTLGFGLYAPFGLGVQWPESSSFRTVGIEGRLNYITANPVLAWKINPQLSIAAGPTLNYSDVQLRQGIGGPVPGDEFRFKGDDFGVGANFGLLWQPHRQWSFGVNYRSATTINYQGRSELSPYLPSTRTAAEIKFPHIVSGGVSFRPTEKWNIEFNVDWSDWSSIDTLTFHGAKDFGGNDIALKLDWHSSFFYHFGATRSFSNGYFASIGYFFSENSTSEKYFTPIVPDTDLHVGSVGGGYRGKNWKWALAGQIITGPWRTVSGSQPSLAGQSADGQYRLFVPTVSFSVGYHF